MCGRYVRGKGFTKDKVYRDLLIDVNGYYSNSFCLSEDYCIVPGHTVPIILQDESKVDGHGILSYPTWGFKELFGDWKRIYNTRFEKLDSPFWKQKSHRYCLVPASGFNEFVYSNGKLDKSYYVTNQESTMYFAGVYSEGAFSIITVPSRHKLRNIHKRCPLFISYGDARVWLHPKLQVNMNTLYKNPNERDLTYYEVDPHLVNGYSRVSKTNRDAIAKYDGPLFSE